MRAASGHQSASLLHAITGSIPPDASYVAVLSLFAVEPQVFDLLVYLVQNRDRVVSKSDLIALVWEGRIVSESTLTSRINAARKAIGDSGEDQKLIRTITRKGFRFVGTVRAEATNQPTGDPDLSLPLPDRPAMAVLPFVNMSGEAEQEYFSDGISEDLITALSKLRWFFVIARNSSFIYKGKSVYLNQVAAELGVRYVVEDSVRKSGDRVRITAQLNDVASGSHLSGRSTTIANSPMCLRSRTKSSKRSSPRSRRSCVRRRISAHNASRPTAWMPGIW